MTSSAITSLPLTVVQLTDPHLFANRQGRLLNVDTDASLNGVIQHIQAQHPHIDLLLATGDITQDGSVAAHRRFLELSDQIPAVLRGLPGNHDVGAAFYDVWQERAQAVTDLGNWRIISLDSCIPGSNGGELRPDQLELLESAAHQAGNRHVLVALHHNPVPIGSLWLDTMMVSNPEQLFKRLEALPQVRAVTWGHVHQEYDSLHTFATQNRSIRLLATPSTCVQFTPDSDAFSLDCIDPGYRWFRLHSDGQLETGVNRVTGLNLQPDASSSGY